MFETLVGFSIGSKLIEKRNFKPIIIINVIFMLIGTFFTIDGINQRLLKTRLQKENNIVVATTYSQDRESLSGNKHSRLYYEWNYNGEYYSSEIASSDGFTENAGAGKTYKIYIDENEPSTFCRVDAKETSLSIGIFLFSIFTLSLISVLKYRKKIITGNLLPKYGTVNKMLTIIGIGLLLVLFVLMLITNLKEFNIIYVIFSLLGLLYACPYYVLISPYFQNKKNYDIKYEDGILKVYYKGKEVKLLHGFDEKSGVIYTRENNKLSCLSYLDNSKMSNFTKNRIMNYLNKWLVENNVILSNKDE